MTARLRPIALVLAFATAAIGQVFAQSPDRRGEIVLDEPAYRGITASAPIPPEMHIRNEGGSDGAGLCVIASLTINGHYQGVGDLHRGKDSRLWRTAKQRPGGYAPQKLERLVEEVMPGETWAEYVGTDPSVLDRLSRLGYPIGSTMNTGALYNYQPIHHMISLAHYRENGYACVIDNNRPGKYSWMPASEYNRRWIDGGIGWAWIWTKLPKGAKPAIDSAALILFAAGLLLLSRRFFHRLGPAVAVGMLFFAMGTVPQANAQGPALPQRAWYNVTIDGQPKQVWGWVGYDGMIHFWPQEQPGWSRPAPKPEPSPSHKPPSSSHKGDNSTHSSPSPPHKPVGSLPKPAEPEPEPKLPEPSEAANLPEIPDRSAPEPKGLLNGVNIQGLMQEGREGFHTNDPAFRPDILMKELPTEKKVPLPIGPNAPREVDVEPWVFWLCGAVIVAAIVAGVLSRQRD